MRTMLAAALLVAALPLTAAAQTGTGLDLTGALAAADAAQPPSTQGPMTIERIHSGVMFAPEVKASRFDDQIKPLIGGSIGWVSDETFFFGGGGYWMPEYGHSDRELGYGGFVMQWFALNSDRVGLSAKVLLGGGWATLPSTVTQYVYPQPDPRAGRNQPLPPPQLVTSLVHVHDHFFVAEPEVNARIAFSRNVRLALGAGYRFANNYWYDGSYYGYGYGYGYGYSYDNPRISGASVTFGVQIGSW